MFEFFGFWVKELELFKLMELNLFFIGFNFFSYVKYDDRLFVFIVVFRVVVFVRNVD